jgi:hypothetical protein
VIGLIVRLSRTHVATRSRSILKGSKRRVAAMGTNDESCAVGYGTLRNR